MKPKKMLRGITAAVLSAAMLLPAMGTAFAAQPQRSVERLSDYAALKAAFLDNDDMPAELYPHGVVSIAQGSTDMQMDKFYEIDLFRQGGTSGEASVTLSTIDLTAAYGKDYELRLSDDLSDSAQPGTACLYFARTGIPYIPVETQFEQAFSDAQTAEEVMQSFIDTNDNAADSLPHSTDVTLTFAGGENHKTVYIRTFKPENATDDRDFMLTVSHPKNCGIGEGAMAVFSIKEERKKPAVAVSAENVEVNPESGTAYVPVKRSGNLGGFTSFTVATKEGSATNEAFVPVDCTLRFMPNVEELLVPVSLKSGAKDGDSFSVSFGGFDSNVEVRQASATITFNKDKEPAAVGADSKKYNTKHTYRYDSERRYEFVDLSSMKRDVCYGSTGKFHYGMIDGNKYKLDRSLKGLGEETFTLRTEESINFAGVKSVYVPYTIRNGYGSDMGGVVVAPTDQLPEYDSAGDKFLKNSKKGSIGMFNLSMSNGSHSIEFDVKGQNQEKGQYIYLVLYAGSGFGGPRYDIDMQEGNSSKCLRLNLQEYKVTMLDPPPVKILKDGVEAEEKLVTNATLTNPGSDTGAQTTEASFYRFDTTTFKASFDSKYGTPVLKGIYICKPGDASKHSALIPLAKDGTYTLTPEEIIKNSAYIDKNRFSIQPVYEFTPVTFKVESYEDKENGVKFTADNSNFEGTYSVNGTVYGTLKWTKPSREDNRYLMGDEVKFTFTPQSAGSSYKMTYTSRAAKYENGLAAAKEITEEGSVLIRDNYESVTPRLSSVEVKPQLVVSHPERGSFSGKGSKFATANPDGTVTVTGYTNESGDVDFSRFAIGRQVVLRAEPQTRCYPVWTYEDAATHKTKTFYGNEFFFYVQNPFKNSDNLVKLDFVETTPATSTTTIFLTGKITALKSTILHPATPSTTVKEPAANAVVYIDSQIATADAQGNFTVQYENGSLPGTMTNYPVRVVSKDGSIDEVHRARVFYDGNYYLCDVELKADKSARSVEAAVTLDPGTAQGVRPTGTSAYSPSKGSYGDSVTLVEDNAVTFTVNFDASGAEKDKPLNLARWTVVSPKGIERLSRDTAIESGAVQAKLTHDFAGQAMQGDRIYIEFYYKNPNKNEYRSYGKYELGYTFVKPNIDKVITYMPDLGTLDPSRVTPKVPGLGSLAPLISFYGFTPVYNDTATGQKDPVSKRDIYVLQIGVQFGGSWKKNAEDKTGKWGVATLSKQMKTLSENLAKERPRDKPFQSLGMTTKISLSASFSYQLNYYLSSSGAKHFVNTAFAFGGNGGLHITKPFLVYGWPFFAYFDFSLKNTGYIINVPNNNTPGYWTSDNLWDADNYKTYGGLQQQTTMEVGLGTGFDGLLSAGGNFNLQFVWDLLGYDSSKVTLSLNGGVFAQALTHKVGKSWKLRSWLLYDYKKEKKQPAAVGAEQIGDMTGEWLDSLTLGDLVFDEAEIKYDDSVGAATLDSEEVYDEINSAHINPCIAQISNNEYLIATVYNTGTLKNTLRCYIYNTDTDTVTYSKNITDAYQPSDNTEKAEFDKCADLVDEVTLTDCGDKLFLCWNSIQFKSNDEMTVADAFRNVRVSGIFFDKATKRFENFDVIEGDRDSFNFNLKTSYNPNSKVIGVFYETVDASSLTNETKLTDLNKLDASIQTSQLFLQHEPAFTVPVTLADQVKTVSDFDVTDYDNDIILSYIGGEVSGKIIDVSDDDESDPSIVDTVNYMYVNEYSLHNYNAQSGTVDVNEESSLLIADENHVTDNPEFVRLDDGQNSNLLLFYKCDGKYGYQNIDNLYLQNTVVHSMGIEAIRNDLMTPTYITSDDEHNVNNDLKVFPSQNGLFALWTSTEGSQQQIWGRDFFLDEVSTVTETAVLDDKGNMLTNETGKPVTEVLDTPCVLLDGEWGGKTKLTTGGVANTDQGYFKDCFDAAAIDGNHILAVYNAFDYDYGDEELGETINTVNNRLVIAEYNISPSYQPRDENDAGISVSEDLPGGGETIEVTARATNTGFKTGSDVTVTLFDGNEYVDSVTYDFWEAEETVEETFLYTLPEDKNPQDVSLHFEVEQAGVPKYVSDDYNLAKSHRLLLHNAHITPVDNITGDGDTAVYAVNAELYNSGNDRYEGGGEVNFVYKDLAVIAQNVNPIVDEKTDEPFYTNFGGEEIPALAPGESVEVCFISNEIPEEIFDRYNTATANLMLALTPADQVGWQEIKGDDEYVFYDELGVGQFVKPEEEPVGQLTAEDVTVPVGFATSVDALTDSLSAEVKITCQSADESIAEVDENGVVKGVSAGETTITLTCGEASVTVKVTVTPPVIGDPDGDGKITVNDVTMIQMYCAEMFEATDEQKKQMDVNGDGRITVMDATALQRYLAEFIYTF